MDFKNLSKNKNKRITGFNNYKYEVIIKANKPFIHMNGYFIRTYKQIARMNKHIAYTNRTVFFKFPCVKIY